MRVTVPPDLILVVGHLSKPELVVDIWVMFTERHISRRTPSRAEFEATVVTQVVLRGHLRELGATSVSLLDPKDA